MYILLKLVLKIQMVQLKYNFIFIGIWLVEKYPDFYVTLPKHSPIPPVTASAWLAIAMVFSVLEIMIPTQSEKQ